MGFTEERRQHQRFKIREGAFALQAQKLGQINDIGIGGLSFQYMSDDSRPVKTSHLDIIMNNSAFRMKQIPVTIISDREIVTTNPFYTQKIRRCSVQFKDLSSDRESLMKRFIEANTVG